MFRRCQPEPFLEVGSNADTALDKNIRCVYAELSINFQYVAVAGLQLAGMTLEGY